MTTLPVTSVSASTDPSTSSTGATSDGSGDSSEGSTSGSSGGSSGDSSESSSGTPESSSSGAQAFEVGWCILQFPATIDAGPDESTLVYARVYVEGITDATEFVDEDALVVAEFGFGDDGSDPAADAWTWLPGEPNPGWDGTMAKGGFGQENNDEYQVELAFPEAGEFDYAARFSADGGTTWTYCDLDDSQTGGYSPDQAGAAMIG